MKTLHLSVALVTLALSASLPAHLFAGAINAAVHLFTPKRGVWTETANFIASDGTADDLLGASLAVSQDSFLAGAPFSDTSGVFNGGAAYYFQLPSPLICGPGTGSSQGQIPRAELVGEQARNLLQQHPVRRSEGRPREKIAL